ncbi:MAG: DUF2341 domain-containing protein [Chitinivibrionales bacterium]|nr:DUF2341 domain-containing protein [Chitinivibrionales bacterium]
MLFCSPDYNPFSDQTNASATVIRKTFGTVSDGDSVEIFHAETLIIVPALREKIKSFRVVIPNNRFNDTIRYINTREQPLLAKEYPVAFSLYDTGFDTISVTTIRENGAAVNENFVVYAHSPLSQNTITGYQGQKIELTTSPVADSDVWYYWIFGDRIKIISPYSRIDTILPSISLPHGIGLLRVSDAKGEYLSPPDSFSYTISDTVPPVITPLHALDSSNLIKTGNTTFILRVEIKDSDQGGPLAVTFNGESYDDHNSSMYIKTIRNLDSLTQHFPYQVTISATDRGGNSDTMKVRIFYDESIDATDNIENTFYSPFERGERTMNRNNIAVGEIISYAGSLNVVLKLSVNDSLYPNPIYVSNKSDTIWQWPVFLDDTINTIALHVYNSADSLLKEESSTMIFDPTMHDTIPPVIADISADGQPADMLFTSSGNVALKIIAFDKGSGMGSFEVNSTKLIGSSISYRWEHTVQLTHDNSGNTISITATDNRGNSSEEHITIYHNNPPLVTTPLNPPLPLRAGITYTDTLGVHDRDNDPLTITLRDAPDNFSLDGSIISWTPSLNDTGENELVFDIEDSLQRITYTTDIVVAPGANDPCTLSITSSRGTIRNDSLILPQNFTHDTLSILIHDNDPAGSEKYDLMIKYDNKLAFQSKDTTRSCELILDSLQTSVNSIHLSCSDNSGETYNLNLTITYQYSSQELFRKRLYINTTDTAGGAGIDSDVYNYPLAVSLTDQNYDFSSDDGNDIRFRKYDGTILPYQLEQYSAHEKLAGFWVLIDTIKGNNNSQYIEMIWGFPDSTDKSNGQQVFDTSNGFFTVYHLNENLSGNTMYENSCSDELNGAGAITATGKKGVIGQGQGFDGENDIINLGTPDIPGDELTISCWLYSPDFAYGPWYEKSYDGRIISKANGTEDHNHWWMLSTIGSSGNIYLRCRLKTAGTTSVLEGNSAALSTNTWTYGVMRYSGKEKKLQLYKYDGSSDDGLVGEMDIAGNIEQNHLIPVWIGANPLSENVKPYNGYIDEMRISRKARSAAWIKLNYEVQHSETGVVRYE